jgi:D-lactate dehydrogenase (cytochrome)
MTSFYTGNFHALLLFQDENEQKIVSEAVHNMVERAIALDGTCEPLFGVFRFSLSIY